MHPWGLLAASAQSVSFAFSGRSLSQKSSDSKKMESPKGGLMPFNSCVCVQMQECSPTEHTHAYIYLNTNAQLLKRYSSGARHLEGKTSHTVHIALSPHLQVPHLCAFSDLSASSSGAQNRQLQTRNYLAYPIYLAYLPLVVLFSQENCTPSNKSFPGARFISECLN